MSNDGVKQTALSTATKRSNMKFLQELTGLYEAEVAGVNHVDIADLIKHFPNNHKKAIEKLWGGERLTWNGIPFHGEGSDSIYGDKLDAAMKEWSSQGGEMHVELSGIDYHPAEGGDPEFIEVSYDQPANPVKDGQEVYMGYDPKSGDLYVGYDMWADEEIFNEEWDTAFKTATGENFEYDEPSHQKAFNEAHKEFANGGSWMLFKIDFNDGELNVDTEDEGDGTFYGSGGRSGRSVSKQMGLIDLRLD